MTLSTFLQGIADGQGADLLDGAIVLARLQRPIDDLIAHALGLGPYHPGKPSPWSHTFLIAEAYQGPDTRILDCTIRDDAGRVDWTGDLLEVLAHGIDKNGGIYDGTVADYDDPRVTAVGLKVLTTLGSSERKAIVDSGRALQAAGYHYDIPGLLRELVRLLTGIPVPSDEKLLFCSAFVQSAYRAALGTVGVFALNVAAIDVSPDDLWYSTLGQGFKPS